MGTDHLYKPGQSGNPAGRPKGCCNKQKLYREVVHPKRKEIVERALEFAMDGQLKGSMRLMVVFLSHVLPAIAKDNLLPDAIDLKDGSLTEQANHIKNLVDDKHITPEQGNVLLANVKATAEIKYKEELEKELYEIKAELAALKAKD